MAGVLLGGRVADTVAPRRLALLSAVGTVAGLLGSSAAYSVARAYAIGTAALAPVAAALLTSLGRAPTFVLLAGALGSLLIAAALLVPGSAPRPRAEPEPPRRSRLVNAPMVALWLAFGLGSAPALAAFAQAGQLAGMASASVRQPTHLDLEQEESVPVHA